ncbi:spermidine hydroxycinnamoyl transferase-like [Macadamia integrifolia]|uniref:spermidine hydroxycinnamoyl transferase-like n=1 Tax=Macadamia integrifolia TaxID=60698 RepID=UPI001C4F3731|nr:spermidine hydroxycinnamoyl transferase-like [Macadamia integrifolia]XP_042509692.1 spermidine hydroxycinnamoyl transferase-like [Macadamia integrifolia]
MVKLVGSYTIIPAQPTPAGKLCLSELDQVKPFTHAPIIYFYRPSNNSIILSSAMDTMRDSLSKVLVQFYPLAGRLQWIEGRRLELDCNSMGAQLFEAESDAEISDFGDFTPTPKMEDLIPPIDYTLPINELPIFLVQLTRFSCGGISVCAAISHSVIDGFSSMQLMNTWAKVSRGGDLDTPPPLIDSRLLRRSEHYPAAPRFKHPEFSPPPVLIDRTDDREERMKETTVIMFELTRDQVEKLKKKANETLTGRPCSRNEAIAAHIWRCASKARQLKYEQPTMMRIAVNSRKRLRPPLPDNYFGNGHLHTYATSLAGELMEKPLGFAASRIREAVERMTDEYFKSAINFLRRQEDLGAFRTGFHRDAVGRKQGDFLGNPNLAITSWLGLPIHGADFGWGKPIYMGPGKLGFDGRSFIIPGPNDDGSIIIPLRMIPAHMEGFTKFFYDDIVSNYESKL